jgi:hypothetical protein
MRVFLWMIRTRPRFLAKSGMALSGSGVRQISNFSYDPAGSADARVRHGLEFDQVEARGRKKTRAKKNVTQMDPRDALRW